MTGVMFPTSPDAALKCINNRVWLSTDQAQLLLSPGRPIVLARKRPGFDLSALIAPGLDEIGVMLPYSPLHHLLLNIPYINSTHFSVEEISAKILMQMGIERRLK